MDSETNHSGQLSAKDYRLSRAELLTEGYKGLLIVNGGAAAALLAFIQAVWKEQRVLADLALVSVGFMVVGLFLAMLVPFLRYHHSLLAERSERGESLTPIQGTARNTLRVCYQLCQYLSASSFLVGAGYLVLWGLAAPA